MQVLVIGGTRMMGIHLVQRLIDHGHEVTIATRGKTADAFGAAVKRIHWNRYDEECIQKTIDNLYFDVVYDSLAYCSNDVCKLLKHLHCGKYIMISSATVYPKNDVLAEELFDPLAGEVVWCNRADVPYDEGKRQAERALFQKFPQINALAVRFPYVIGRDDYTKRLRFYVEHICQNKSMFVDNLDTKLTFVNSTEAGRFLAYFADYDCFGVINGANSGRISIREIADYVEQKTGMQAIFTPDGDAAPYNGDESHSISTEKAVKNGFVFSPLHHWIYELLDSYVYE